MSTNIKESPMEALANSLQAVTDALNECEKERARLAQLVADCECDRPSGELALLSYAKKSLVCKLARYNEFYTNVSAYRDDTGVHCTPIDDWVEEFSWRDLPADLSRKDFTELCAREINELYVSEKGRAIEDFENREGRKE